MPIAFGERDFRNFSSAKVNTVKSWFSDLLRPELNHGAPTAPAEGLILMNVGYEGLVWQVDEYSGRVRRHFQLWCKRGWRGRMWRGQCRGRWGSSSGAVRDEACHLCESINSMKVYKAAHLAAQLPRLRLTSLIWST
ncbi:hypothetical protein [Methanothrix sp.]|uniref:hypothetical protein n=1 Tax=Methanothrix sp. TaxID=90426 RepID=UPI00345E67A7